MTQSKPRDMTIHVWFDDAIKHTWHDNPRVSYLEQVYPREHDESSVVVWGRLHRRHFDAKQLRRLKVKGRENFILRKPLQSFSWSSHSMFCVYSLPEAVHSGRRRFSVSPLFRLFPKFLFRLFSKSPKKKNLPETFSVLKRSQNLGPWTSAEIPESDRILALICDQIWDILLPDLA